MSLFGLTLLVKFIIGGPYIVLTAGFRFCSATSGWKKKLFAVKIEKMRAFTPFTKKYLRQYGCSDSNFTAAVN